MNTTTESFPSGFEINGLLRVVRERTSPGNRWADPGFPAECDKAEQTLEKILTQRDALAEALRMMLNVFCGINTVAIKANQPDGGKRLEIEAESLARAALTLIK